MLHTELIQSAFTRALQAIALAANYSDSLPAPVLEHPKDPNHGDIACTAALAFAKLFKQTPRLIAEQLKIALLADLTIAPLLESVEIAGPGFINIRLSLALHQAIVLDILENPAYGAGTAYTNQAIVVEFVSANPTGPLHVGHTRQAALGDAICNLLTTQGAAVTREFYYNDAGNQIANLALSVQLQCQGITPLLADGSPNLNWPENGYRGDYIADIASDYLAADYDLNDLNAIRHFAVAYLRQEQNLDLQALGLTFDVFYLESSLYTEGHVRNTVDALIASGKTYQEQGALWLRSTDYGDDKDRVMRKSNSEHSDNGGYTYFVPDVAYHVQKWTRGFTKAINIQGTDHHGTIARVRAGLQALNIGIPNIYPDYVLHSMVKVLRGGVEVKISKRAGSYVTMRDLIDWVGRDAVRYFLVSRKADSEFVFDIDLALAKSEDNPVYYIQYAHARICSVFTAAQINKAKLEFNPKAINTALLIAPKEITLLKRLAEYPSMLASAAQFNAPHTVAHWLRDCAADFHSYYNAEKVLVDNNALKEARLALYRCTRQVIRHGLALLGMSAPEKM
jgi:arginyl-tRNA synthetase